MSKTISFGLSVKEVEKARKEVLKYKKDLLKKCQRFVNKLADLGISVAKQHVSSGYGKYIIFSKEIDQQGSTIKGIMYATNTGLIRSEWRIGPGENDIATADVSPLLMAEFGAGKYAERNKNGPRFGMGRGTFPGQTHAEDPDGWWYMDKSGVWNHSYGVTPTMPMSTAAEQMMANIASVAREVFK